MKRVFLATIALFAAICIWIPFNRSLPQNVIGQKTLLNLFARLVEVVHAGVCASTSLGNSVVCVQSATASNTTASVSFGSNTTVHNAAVATWRYPGLGIGSPVCVTAGWTWATPEKLNDTGQGLTLAIMVAQDITAATTPNVNCSDDAGSTVNVTIYEFSGLATSSAVDTQGGAFATTSAPSAPMTTTNAIDLLVGWAGCAANTLTVGSGFTVLEAPAGRIKAEAKTVTSTGSNPANWTVSSDDCGATGVALKTAAATTIPGQFPRVARR